MPIIEISTFIGAPIERVFDLSLSVELHIATASASGERAIGGVTSGILRLHDEVTWQAVHFGVRQKLMVRITQFERPYHFQDTMLRGAFKSMKHDHYFESVKGGTLMRDLFLYQSPLWWLGTLADQLFLKRYMRNFLLRRNEVLRGIAESEAWRTYLRND